MMSALAGRVILALAASSRLSSLARRHGARLGVGRFVAGFDLQQALITMTRLEAQGFVLTVDHLGEGARREEAAEAAASAYLDLLDGIARVRSSAHVSLKLTELGLDLDAAAAQRRVVAIAERARTVGSLVRIDMEDSAHLDATLAVLRAVRRSHPGVGVVIQARLRRARADLLQLLAEGVRVRLVKGAYQEPARLAYQDRAEVDRSYLTLAHLALAAGADVAFATHDTALIAAIKAQAAAMGRHREQVEFQMLYGVRPRLQREIRDAGHPLRIYLPYGQDWYPYFMRRIAERPQNLAFVLRQLGERRR